MIKWFELCKPVKFYNFQSSDYMWPLPDGFPLASRVIIEGIPTVDTSDINFLTKLPSDGEGDIVSHISVRYGIGSIVYNTLITGEGWQEEEQYSDKSISAGDPFKIIIIREFNHFSLHINGNQFKEFRHRMSPEKIQCLAVGRSVTVTALTVDRIHSINWPLSRGFRENDTITITGVPGIYKSSDEFLIIFQNSSTCEKSGDIPLHMTVQFEEGNIINNSYESKVWRGKKIQQNLFLEPKKQFIISISNKGTFFKVFVNDKEFTYDASIPHDKITYLIIQDNIYVWSVKVISAMID